MSATLNDNIHYYLNVFNKFENITFWKKMHVDFILSHRIKKVQYVVLRKSCLKVYDGYCAYNYCN